MKHHTISTPFAALFALCLLLAAPTFAATTGEPDAAAGQDLSAVLRYQDENGSFLGEKGVGALGVIGTDGRRFRIRFLTVERAPEKPLEYAVSGKTRVGDNICDFTGTAAVEAAEFPPRAPENAEAYRNHEEGLTPGLIRFRLDLAENSDQPGTGRLTGFMDCDVVRDGNGVVKTDTAMLGADGYDNNRFVGQWTSYKTGQSKPVNFGAFRIPHEGLPEELRIDSGVGEFVPEEKLASDPNSGWADYRVCMFGMRFPKEYPGAVAACEREFREWWR